MNQIDMLLSLDELRLLDAALSNHENALRRRIMAMPDVPDPAASAELRSVVSLRVRIFEKIERV